MLSKHLNMFFIVIVADVVAMEDMFEISIVPVEFPTKTS